MGLRTLFQNAAVTAFAAAGDIVQEVEVKIYEPVDYNPVSGQTTEGYSLYCVKMLPSKIESDSSEFNDVQASDIKGSIIQSDLSEEPKMGDNVTYNCVNWRVQDVNSDPAGALWTLLLRRV